MLGFYVFPVNDVTLLNARQGLSLGRLLGRFCPNLCGKATNTVPEGLPYSCGCLPSVKVAKRGLQPALAEPRWWLRHPNERPLRLSFVQINNVVPDLVLGPLTCSLAHVQAFPRVSVLAHSTPDWRCLRPPVALGSIP